MSVEWGPASDGLRLGLAADGQVAALHLQNIGAEALDVLSHVLAGGEIHLDWFTVHVAAHDVTFVDDRDRSTPVTAHLRPGETLQHTIDVAAWAARTTGPLSPGAHRATATYLVESAPDVWCGRLDAGPVTLTVAAPPPGEC
jgi:hypothetical protein